MNKVLKFLGCAVAAIVLFLGLACLVSPSVKAALQPVYGSNGVVTFGPNTSVTLVAGAATVADTTIAAGCEIVIGSPSTVGGTIASQPYVATITPGTGFTIAGGGGSNTSTYQYYVKYQ